MPSLRYVHATASCYSVSYFFDMQTVRSNKEDCLELAQQVTEYLYAITCTYDESVVHEVGDHFHANVEVLYQ